MAASDERLVRQLVPIVLMALATLVHGQARARAPCDRHDAACAAQAAQASPVRHLSYWQVDQDAPLSARIGAAPPALVTYLQQVNIAQGFTQEPLAAEPSAAFRADVNAAIDAMPAVVRRLVAHKLIGIFFVHGLGSSGFTDIVAAEHRAEDKGFIVLDLDALAARTANQWSSWKENTPFGAGPHHLLSVIESPAEDLRRQAIQYILLHEFGHVVSIGTDLVPPWNEPPPADKTLSQYRFSRLSFRVNAKGDGYVSLFDQDFVERARVVFYRGARLTNREMVPTYQALAATNFPTLYAATAPGDDFAEAFANYVHTVMLQRPMAITISTAGHEELVYHACWQEPRCAQKAAILAELLDEHAP